MGNTCCQFSQNNVKTAFGYSCSALRCHLPMPLNATHTHLSVPGGFFLPLSQHLPFIKEVLLDIWSVFVIVIPDLFRQVWSQFPEQRITEPLWGWSSCAEFACEYIYIYHIPPRLPRPSLSWCLVTTRFNLVFGRCPWMWLDSHIRIAILKVRVRYGLVRVKYGLGTG